MKYLMTVVWLVFVAPVYAQTVNEGVYKVTPDAQGLVIFPVQNVFGQIRLWTAGPPQAATNWWIVLCECPQPPVRDRIESRHRATVDNLIDRVLAHSGVQITDYGVTTRKRGFHMDIVVPQTLIDALEAR